MSRLELPPAARVLVADAQAVVRSGYRYMVEQALTCETVAEAADADETYQAYLETRPDLVILGVSLPQIGGLELTRRITGGNAGGAILLFGLAEDSYLAMRAIDAGAMGFVSREDDVATILEAMRTVAQQRPFLARTVMQRVALQRVSPRTDPIASLSAHEFEIFRLLTEGRAVTEVAKLLSLSARSVANYQTQIKRKLGVRTTAGMVHIAIRHGVVQVGRT